MGYVLLAQRSCHQAIEHLHEALSLSPLDPLGTSLLNLTLETAAEESKSLASANSLNFPALSKQIGESLDKDVNNLEQQWKTGETSQMDFSNETEMMDATMA